MFIIVFIVCGGLCKYLFCYAVIGVFSSFAVISQRERERERERKSWLYYFTVKPVENGHSNIDKPMILMTNGCLMQVKSVAECFSWSILQSF